MLVSEKHKDFDDNYNIIIPKMSTILTDGGKSM